MNDDTPILSAELASAYLDNEATPEERARIEASPELQAQVADFVQLRTQLAAITPVRDEVREAAFAAAMGVFGVAEPDVVSDTEAEASVDSAATAVPTPAAPRVAPVVSLAARRQRMYRVVTGVAAASVLVVGGIAVLNNAGGSDQEATSVTAPSAKIEAAAPAETAAPADEAMTVAAAPAETTAPADSVATAVGGGGQAAESATAASDVGLPVIADPAELAAFVATAPAGDELSTTYDVARVTCPTTTALGIDDDSTFLGEIFYAGELAVVVRRADGSVQAISLASCAVLTQIPPP
jgi:hypothetical protein